MSENPLAVAVSVSPAFGAEGARTTEPFTGAVFATVTLALAVGWSVFP